MSFEWSCVPIIAWRRSTSGALAPTFHNGEISLGNSVTIGDTIVIRKIVAIPFREDLRQPVHSCGPIGLTLP